MKKYLFGLIVVIPVVSASWFFLQRPGMRTGNTSIIRSSELVAAANFRDVCDCFALVEESGKIERVDVMTGERQPLLSPAAKGYLSAYSWAAYAPDGRQVAMVSADLSSVVLVDTLSGEGITVYTAPDDDAVVSLVWAGNGQKFVVSVGSRSSADVPTAIDPNRLVLVDTVSKLTSDIVTVASNPSLVSLIPRPMFVRRDGQAVFFADSQGKQWQWRSDRASLSDLPAVFDFQISFSEEDTSTIYARIIGDFAVFGYRTKIRIVSLKDFSENIIDVVTAADQPYSESNPAQDSLLLLRSNERGSGASLVRLSLATGTMVTVLDTYPVNSGLADFFWTPSGSSFIVRSNAGAETYLGQFLEGKVVLKKASDVPTGIRTFVLKSLGSNIPLPSS